MIDALALKGRTRLVLRDRDGQVKDDRTVENLVTNAGRDALIARFASSPGTAVPTHMAIGEDNTAAAGSQTTLENELDRNALDSCTASGNVLTMVASWAEGDGTGTIVEAGVFSASSSGTMFSRAVFGSISKGADDTLEITWTYTLTVGS